MNRDNHLMLEMLQKKWKLTSMHPAEAATKFGQDNVKVTAKGLRNGQDMVEVHVPVDDKGHDAPAEDAEHNHAQRIITSELHKVHTILNQLSTMIDLNRSAETDQLLSKIRDASEMLMTDSPAENEEDDAEDAPYASGQVGGRGEEHGAGEVKLLLLRDEKFDCYLHGTVQSVSFSRGTMFHCEPFDGEFYNCESDEYGTIAITPDAHMKIVDAPAGSTNTEDEDAEGRSNAQHAAIAISLQKAGKKPA